MAGDHIHVPDDGRGLREVFVNGKRYDRVFYADTKKGYADFYLYPYQIDRKWQELKSDRVFGKVEVRYV